MPTVARGNPPVLQFHQRLVAVPVALDPETVIQRTTGGERLVLQPVRSNAQGLVVKSSRLLPVGYSAFQADSAQSHSSITALMKIVEARHPLVRHKIGLLRNPELSTREFRELTNEIGTLLAYEATADLPTETVTVPGWAGDVQVQRLAGAKITLVPILRAGLGMLNGVLDLLPSARVSVVGLQRDEQTLQPVPYFERLTGRLEERDTLILDPMLATGGTLIATVDMLKRAGAKRIKGIFLVAAPEGLKALEAAHPDVEVYTAAIDEHLNEKGYILPGLGDAGDRIFGTRVLHD